MLGWAGLEAIVYPINWRSQGVTIPLFSSDSAVCVHEHLETKTGGVSWDRTRRATRAADLQSTASPLMLLLQIVVVTRALEAPNSSL
jgi:hypothetical protein